MRRIASSRAAPQLDASARVTPYVEIVAILTARERPMTTREIADAVNHRGLYTKRDGSAITPFRIHGRTRNYPQLADQKGQPVILRPSHRW